MPVFLRFKTVITIQQEINKEEMKLSKGMLSAFCHKWSFVSSEFTMQYRDAEIALPVENNKASYLLDITNLKSLLASSLAKVTLSNTTHHILENNTISAHQTIKKQLREKSISKKKKERKECNSKVTPPGYSTFMKKNYQKFKEETGITDFVAL